MKGKRRFSRASKEGEPLGLLCRRHNPPVQPQPGGSLMREENQGSL